MAYRPLSRFLFRAPLLPMRALARPAAALATAPLGPQALALASADLAAALARRQSPLRSARQDEPSAARALGRYGRRAAFRPTPHGLLAGVGVGVLGARTEMWSGPPAPVLRAAWDRLAALARALLDRPAMRSSARLRRAPSVVRGVHTVLWLGPGGDGEMIEERRSEIDDLVARALDATARWAPWPEVRAAIADLPEAAAHDDAEAVDDLLLAMIDDGLLHVDLVPPLVGPEEPGAALRARLAAGAATAAAASALGEALAALRAGDLERGRTALAALPGAGGARAGGVHATLVFPSATTQKNTAANAAASAAAAGRPRPPTLARAAVERAAALAPLLMRLGEALAPPTAERTPDPALADALDAITEQLGAGAIDLAALAVGDYGVDAAASDGAAPPNTPEAPLVALLVDRTVAAARRRSPEVSFTADELLPLLPELEPPPTCELFLAPCRPRPRAPAGAGWLLGVHAPAGATWGRFAFALGDGAARPLFDELAAAERRARPGEEPVDVAFAPAAALADLSVHPPLRRRTLALTSWSAAARATGRDGLDDLTAEDLELVADAAALEPLALRERPAGPAAPPVSPAPLHRVRSTTAPAGVWRLLAGWRLHRQHAPWAAVLGPLFDLEWTPRLTLDGFVIAPASWRVPPAVAVRGAPAGAVAAWRRAARLPRWVQVGHEDELLPVDLGSPDAAADLAGAARVFEIWPPLGDTVDADGRRIEAVVALADEPDAAGAAHVEAAVSAAASAGATPPPRRQGPAPGWHTFKLFGAADRQDAVLLGAAWPAVKAARAAGEIAGWFFLRYVDGPGRRPHLRLRVRTAPGDDGAAAFARRLDDTLAAAVASGDVTGVERAPYFPEAARFGGAGALPAVHAVFEADSDLACALLSAAAEADTDDVPDRLSVLLVVALDALAAACGLDAVARRDLAHRRRAAHAADVSPDAGEALDRDLRRLGRPLRAALLAAPEPPEAAAALRAFSERVRRAVAPLDAPARARALPALLHLAAVRLAGMNRLDEIRAYTFWERAREGIDRAR